MNTSNRDITACSLLEPNKVASYLIQNGWERGDQLGDKAYIWHKTSAVENLQILLPLKPEISDFSYRMYELVEVVSVEEGRPVSEVLSSLASESELAKKNNHELLSIALSYIGSQSSSRAPAKSLGVLLQTLQDLFDSLGQLEHGAPTERGVIPKDVTNCTSLSLIGTFKGSFGVRLAASSAAEQANLLEQPLAVRTFGRLLSLLNTTDKRETQKLAELLISAKKRVVSNYKKFLISVAASNANLRFEWGSLTPNNGGMAWLSYESAVTTIGLIGELIDEVPEEYEILGVLVGLDVDGRTFKIIELEDQNKIYRGNIAPTFNKEVLEVPKIYWALLQENLKLNSTTGEAKIQYTLMAVRPPEPKEKALPPEPPIY
jgi:hypothetical protein